MLPSPIANESCSPIPGSVIATQSFMESTRTVYILRSLTDPTRHYTGRTSNVTRRLDWHNAGLNTHTARHRPWQLLVSVEFHVAAARFERYLKTGSGRAFAKRHFA
jgi:predicted GIY-YIG superfamily endonuclease